VSTPLVTVVIPAYNGGVLLRAAVDSVLAQTYEPIEIVVVDDESPEPLEPFLDGVLDRVRIVRQQNTGTAGARNRGIAEARGELVALLDQDDLWDPEKLARQLPLFVDSRTALVHAGARFINAEGTVTSVVTGDPTLDTHRMLEACHVAVQTVVVRRSILDEVGPFDVSLSAADDWDMWIRIIDRFPIAAVPDPLATVRVHPGNQSHNAELMYSSARQLIAKHAHIHGACPDCRRALRRAALANRQAYYGRLRHQARERAAAGDRGAALRLTAKAIRRHPRALLETPLHHLNALTTRRSSAAQ
jgi:glycosyltransferase involved in cell wall biosynthesis